MQENLQIDELDKRIISALELDGRRSYADIASEVSMSTAAVHERARKLLDKGIIKRFSVTVNHDALGLHLTAFISIRIESSDQWHVVRQTLRQMSEVVELHSVAGEHDALAKVRCTNARALEDVIYKIKAISGVSRTTSTIVLSTDFE